MEVDACPAAPACHRLHDAGRRLSVSADNIPVLLRRLVPTAAATTAANATPTATGRSVGALRSLKRRSPTKDAAAQDVARDRARGGTRGGAQAGAQAATRPNSRVHSDYALRVARETERLRRRRGPWGSCPELEAAPSPIPVSPSVRPVSQFPASPFPVSQFPASPFPVSPSVRPVSPSVRPVSPLPASPPSPPAPSRADSRSALCRLSCVLLREPGFSVLPSKPSLPAPASRSGPTAQPAAPANRTSPGRVAGGHSANGETGLISANGDAEEAMDPANEETGWPAANGETGLISANGHAEEAMDSANEEAAAPTANGSAAGEAGSTNEIAALAGSTNENAAVAESTNGSMAGGAGSTNGSATGVAKVVSARLRPLSRSTPVGLDHVGGVLSDGSPSRQADDDEDDDDLASMVGGPLAGGHGGRAPHPSRLSPPASPHRGHSQAVAQAVAVRAESLWHRVSLRQDELSVSAGEELEVVDGGGSGCGGWWWCRASAGQEGWVPASFLRLRVNQEAAPHILSETGVGLDPPNLTSTTSCTTTTATASPSTGSSLAVDEMRSRVIREIFETERHYVNHLIDICEGYISQCRRREDMFSAEQLATIFGNVEEILAFHSRFLAALQRRLVAQRPHSSCVGAVFLEHRDGFRVYSEYCNNHPRSSAELARVCRSPRHLQLLEACRLRRGMAGIPLAGFLLTPVQKICKYPLQLAELLKYTPRGHGDYVAVGAALEGMRGVARLINERKRRIESVERIAHWQRGILDWQGPDVLQRSSELVQSGELMLLPSVAASASSSSSRRPQLRVFFLFEHQLVYCKKDLLRKDMLYYCGRIPTDGLTVEDIPDGKNDEFQVCARHAIRLTPRGDPRDPRDPGGDPVLLTARRDSDKTQWLSAFAREASLVSSPSDPAFVLSDAQREQARQDAMKAPQRSKPRGLTYSQSVRHRRTTHNAALQAAAPQAAAPLKRKPSAFWVNLGKFTPFRK